MKKQYGLGMTVLFLLAIFLPLLKSFPVQASTQGTKTITIHKILTDRNGTSNSLGSFTTPEGYDGTQTIDQFNALLQAAGRSSVIEIKNVYFALQNGDGQWIDKTGQVVASADEAYGMLTSPTGAVFDTSQLPAGNYKIAELHDKTTYSGQYSELLTDSQAVPVEITLPLVKADGTTIEHAHTYPKNTQGDPFLQKTYKLPVRRRDIPGTPSSSAEDVLANLGSVVEYSVKVEIPEKAKYTHLSFVDTMTEGLTLTTNRFGQKVYISTKLEEGVPQYEQGADKDYTVDYTSNQSYTLTFTPKGLEKLRAATNESKGREFTIRYTAYINANAYINADVYSQSEQVNTVIMYYGNNPNLLMEKFDMTRFPVTSTKFVKMDGRTEQRLPLAQFTAKTRAKDPTDGLEKDFYLAWKPVTGYGIKAEEEAKIATLTEKQTLFHAALDAYNALSKTQKEDPAEKKKALDAKKAFDDAFAAAHVTYVWDSEKTNPNVLRLTSNEKGQFFLLNYYKTTTIEQKNSEVDYFDVTEAVLEEVSAPGGYSILTSPIALTLDYEAITPNGPFYQAFITGLPETLYDDAKPELGNAYRINNVRITIPQTGGIGSLVFVGLGAVFAGIAIYYLRDRKDKEDSKVRK